jgi:hypothetical protein
MSVALVITFVTAYAVCGLLVRLWYETRLERNTSRIAAMTDATQHDPRHYLAVGLLEAMQAACIHLQGDRKSPNKLTLFFLVTGPLGIPAVLFMEVMVMRTERRCQI